MGQTVVVVLLATGTACGADSLVGDRLARLPAYAMDIRLDTTRHRVAVTQTVRWQNPGNLPTQELVFQVTANNRPSDETLKVARRTVESLRLNPRFCIDEKGRRFHLVKVTQGKTALTARFDERHDTHLSVLLANPVLPGDTVKVELEYWIDLPQVMGRLGQHKGVTNLLNWYPVLAVYQDDMWQPVPYIPWHQPWFNEAGNYDVRLKIPERQVVVTGGRVVSETVAGGYRNLVIQGDGLRDFTIVASAQFRELKSSVDGIPVRVTYLPGHEDHAQLAVKTATECIRSYGEWFGPYPYREFELTESYFGWNGNESSGVVMIDARIMDTPKYVSRYVEHLISHEICHQWWYSAVGTDGYHEPWMDEGLVQWFTRVRMEDKYGPDPNMLTLPGYGVLQFPNVSYRSLVHGGYNMYRDRGGEGASLGSLEDMGHLHNLFFLVYDRGARITGMIQHRLGRESFMAFMKQLYVKYQFRILTARDYQRELEEYTGESWQPFFDTWLRSGGDSDWKLDQVDVSKAGAGYQTRIRVSQAQEIPEPVEVGITFRGESSPFRLATLGEAESVQQNGMTVERASPTDWLVTVSSETEPTQIQVDPNGDVLDANPHNNRWTQSYQVRVSPFYTPVDEAALMQPWNERSIVAGFGVDSDGRIGFRSALLSSNRFRIAPFVSYTAATASRNDDHISAGVDAIFYNVPSANWQLLARYEHALLSTVANDPGHQAKISLRRVLQYTTSLIYPNLSYVDVYTRFGDNFFPDQDNTMSLDPRIEEYNDVRAFGVDFHADSQMPYWDPDSGVRFDANYERGICAFGGGAGYNRVSAQVGVVQRLSDAPGWLAETKLAGRLAGGYGWEDNGQHFRFGGPGRFRGRDATATEGNAFWLTSMEWRFPILGELDFEVVDNTAALQSVHGSVFYDVGRSFQFDQPQGRTDHAVGGGLYFQVPLLSFVENLTIRTEYGYSLINSTGSFWFGLYRAF